MIWVRHCDPEVSQMFGMSATYIGMLVQILAASLLILTFDPTPWLTCSEETVGDSPSTRVPDNHIEVWVPPGLHIVK